MKISKRLKYFAASFLMLFSTVTPLGGSLVPSVYAAGNPPATAPSNEKTIKDNGDGTYTIALSVTGKTSTNSTSEVSKANVILVMDTSSSMNNDAASTNHTYYAVPGTPDAPSSDGVAATYYRNDNGTYRQLYYRNNAWRTSNSNNGTVFTGQFYARSRLWAVKHTMTDTDGVIDSLLSQNVAGDAIKKDIVEIAIVDFGKAGATQQGFTTNATTLKNAINGLTTSQGTNWEEGLQQAKILADAIKASQPNEAVHIIFLTDGEPTTHSGDYSVNTNYAQEWAFANDDARSIITAGYTLYGLFTWGSGNSSHYLSSLIQYAYTGTGNSNSTLQSEYQQYFTNASSTSTLIEALKQIVNDIVTKVGYGGVELEDGVTEMTHSNIKASTDGKVTGLKYYRSGGPYSTTANDGLGEEWADAPKATLNEDGEVDWKLGDNFILEDGVTYTMTFIVWPEQEALDLVEKLNNGIVSYESLTEDERGQIKEIVSGDNKTYKLKTNTDFPTLTYKTVTTTTVNGVPTTTESDYGTIEIENPDPVDLYTREIALQKLWEDTLDPSQREKEVGDIYLQFYRDGKEYAELPEYEVDDDGNPIGIKISKIPGSSVWGADTISIAPGLMVSEGHDAYDSESGYDIVSATINGVTKNYAILNPGHDYVFGEEDINNHFELTNYTYHPMLVDGVLMNVKFTKSGEHFTGVESAEEMTTISATNTIKGGINVSKKVVDEDNNVINDAKDEFDVKIHLINADGTPFAYDYRVYTYTDGTHTGDYVSRTGHICSTGTENDNCEKTTDQTGLIEETITVNDVIRVVNIPSGVMYYVEEGNVPKGYSYDNTEYTIAYGSGNGSADAVAKTENDKNYYAVKGNSASSAVITNKYVSGNLEISKTINFTSGNETTAKAKKFGFEIKIYTDSTKATELTTPYKIEGKTETITSGGTFILGDGESIKILGLPEGAYYEVVEKGVYSGDELLEFTDENNYGYTQSSTGATGEIVKNTTKTAAFTNTYSVSGKVTIQAKKDLRGRNWLKDDTFIFNLTGNGQNQTAAVSEGKTAEFEVPINNTGTFEYTIVEDIADMKGGLTRQTAKITAVVVATDNGDGTLSFTTAYRDGDTLECGEDEEDCDTTQNVIVNTYSSEGSIELGASKILTGRDWKDGEQYTFTLLHGTDVLGNEVVNKDKTTVTFDKITYTTEDVGNTFVYIIRETSTLPGGVTNSGDITATVTLTDNNDGTITTTVVYTDKDGKETNTIINTYSATGNVVLKANKALVGRDWKEGETYYFVLKNESGTEIERVPVKKDGEISFTALNFTLADVGTHTYTITEEGLPTNEGMAKSDDITVTIKIEDAGEGRLGIVESYSATTITNTYTSAGEITLQATKKLTGREWLDSDAFTFTLSGEGIEEQNRQATSGNKTVTFGKITYDQDDVKNKTTYTYTISETAGYQGKGLTKSGDITATVTLSDDGKGHISTSVVYKNANNEESNIIENTYATSGSVVLEANKKLTGRPWDTDESYTFALKQGDTVIETKEVSDGNLHVEFKEIKYTAAGTYTYKIEETDTLPSYMSQNGPITVTVEVTDDNAGHLTATPIYSIEDKTITNTYTATGSIQLEATKKIDGRDWLGTDEFDFELSGGNLTKPQTITLNKDKQKAVFDVINYTEKDIAETYTYTIKETSAMPAGMTAGDALTVTVRVEDNKDGTLKATAIYSNEEKVITNTYEANGKIQLEATKEIVGRDWMKDLDEFEFKLSGNGVEDTQTVDVDHKTVKFEELSFDQSDAGKTYTYTIEETTDLSDLSMTNSGVITVKVTVTDKGNGELEVSAVYEGGEGDKKNTIVNTYTANGTAGLDVKKVLEGRKWQSGESFEFGVFAEGSNDPIRTGTATEDSQLIHFDLIEYDQDDYLKSDTYTYTIREISDLSGKGFGEPNEVVATVTLTDDGKGNIESSVSYTNDDTIKNIYSAEGSIALKAEKAFVGARTWQEGECFSFVLKDESGDIDTQQVCADGEVTFEALSFTEEDIDQTYTYTIAEDDNLPAGVSNDGDITVTVKISDNLDGSLKVTAEYAKGEEKTNKIINTYETSSTDVTFHVDKSIDNQSGSDLDGKEFKFELVDADTNKVLQTITVTTDGETGEADFDAIEYTKVGTHNYIIREVNDEQPGFSYDESEYKIKVEVTDNYDEAQLEAKTTITLDGAETSDIKFENPYKAEETSAVISVTKILEGMNEGVEAVDFEFVLTNEDGEEETITIKPVDGEGEGEFSEITFDKVGEYIYTVRENNTEEPGYTYDDSEFTVIINVEDNNGELVATVSYLKDDEEADGISFTNYYATEDLIYEGVIMKKVLEGRDLQDGEFSFEIYLDGELVTTGHNDADGVIIFDDPITFTEPGTYTFTVKENTDEEIEFVTFDENEYEFTIEVIDNGMGELEVVEDTSSEVIFTNKYEEPEPGKGENPRTLDDIMSAVAVFVISLFGLIGSVIFGKRFLKEEE